MRDGNNFLGALVARRGPLSAGGYVTGGDVADDDTQVCRVDVFGAYFRRAGDAEWTQLVRPGPVVGQDGCNILASQVLFDPATQGAGLGDFSWGRVGAWDVGICATNSNAMACLTAFGVYGTIDGGATVFRCTNLPYFTTEGMNPNGRGGAYGGNRIRGRSLVFDPANRDHVLLDTPSGVYRTTNFSAGSASTWTLISTAQLPARSEDTKRNQIAFDRSSPVVGGITQRIYVMVNDGGLRVSENGGTTWTAVSGSPTNAGHLAVHPTTGIVYLGGGFTGAAEGQLHRYDRTGPTWTAPTVVTSVRGVAFSSQNAAHVYCLRSTGEMFFSNNSGLSGSWVLCPQNTGDFIKSAPNDLWHEYSGTGISYGDMAFSPTQNRIYLWEGFGCWYCDNPPTANTQTPTWTAQHEGISSLVAMGCEFTPLGDLLVSCQDKAAWVITKSEIDAGTNATKYAPDPSGLSYGQSMDWAKSDPSFLCFARGFGVREAYKSLNRGGSWAQLGAPTAALREGNLVALTPQNMLWVPGSNSGQLHLTQDGGDTWTPLTLNGSAWTRWHNAYFLSRRIALALEDGSGYVVYCHGFTLAGPVDSNAIGFWFVSPSGTVTRLSNTFISMPRDFANKDFFDSKFKEVPGHNGHFLWAGGNGAAGLYKSTNLLTVGVGNEPWAAIGPSGGFGEVRAFGMGKARPGNSYPIIRAFAWGNEGGGMKYGLWESEDGGNTWTYLTQFIRNVYDEPLDMAGDRNRFGRWCIAYKGKGVDIIDYDYKLRLA